MKEEHISLRGYQIRVLATQPQQYNTVLVFVHGGGGRADQWQDQLAYFASRGKEAVVAMDLLGHGGSDKPKPSRRDNPYHFDGMVSDVLAICRRFSADQVVLIGHSYGGPMVIRAMQQLQEMGPSQDHANTCAALLFAPAAFEPFRYRRLLSLMPVALLERMRHSIGRAFQRAAFHPQTDEQLKVRESEITDNNPMYVMKALLLGTRSLKRMDFSSHSERLLVVLGEADRAISRQAAIDCYGAWHGSEVVTMTGVGHMMMLEDPIRTRVIIEGYLNSLRVGKVTHLHAL